MNGASKPVLLFVGGILVGYMLSRVLDSVPLVNKLPKIRI